ncbi:MAG TPA: FAD-dependent oxidoreductase, partial [Methylomirabilota bacterium]|nr:FAD-dependent oxidoreductase [Methylomirabilota bacterium]
MRAEEVDVAVVGAGMAGLAAATELKGRGASFVVLEARDRVGGRLQSVELEPGTWIDVGGQWVGPTQDRLYALARAHGAELFPTWTAGENVVEIGGRLARYTGTIPRLRPHVLADVSQAMLRIDRLAAKVPVEAPWEAPKAMQWDSQTTWSWLRRNMATRGGRALMEIGVKAVWAAMPADVSFLHFLFYVASAGRMDLLLDTEGGAQQDRFVGGSQLISLRLAEQLGDAIRLEAPVRAIEHGDGGVV